MQECTRIRQNQNGGKPIEEQKQQSRVEGSLSAGKKQIDSRDT